MNKLSLQEILGPTELEKIRQEARDHLIDFFYRLGLQLWPLFWTREKAYDRLPRRGLKGYLRKILVELVNHPIIGNADDWFLDAIRFGPYVFDLFFKIGVRRQGNRLAYFWKIEIWLPDTNDLFPGLRSCKKETIQTVSTEGNQKLDTVCLQIVESTNFWTTRPLPLPPLPAKEPVEG